MSKIVKIRALTLEAGPEGIIQPGQVLELDAKDAKEKVESGYGEYVKEDEEEGGN